MVFPPFPFIEFSLHQTSLPGRLSTNFAFLSIMVYFLHFVSYLVDARGTRWGCFIVVHVFFNFWGYFCYFYSSALFSILIVQHLNFLYALCFCPDFLHSLIFFYLFCTFWSIIFYLETQSRITCMLLYIE